MERGFFPLDKQLGIEGEYWSEGVLRDMVWLSGQVPYEDVETIMQRLSGVHSTKTSIWRRVQVWGERFRQEQEKERAQAKALPSLWEWESWRGVKQRQRMGVAMDMISNCY